MRALGPTLLFFLLAPGAALAQVRPCAGVDCSGRGECMEEGDRGYCFCEEGFSAVGLSCVESGPSYDPEVEVSGMHVVGIALAEHGRDLEHVGARSGALPGPLARFVGESSTPLWCSDFVAWVYRAAGVPFTGGYQGGWHLTNNHMIRAWYVRRGAFVAQGTPAWRHARPMPGDYVRIHTRTWGHSAIVRYATDSTLYTVEGNAGGRVIVTHYDGWRTHERIDGFGYTIGATRRMNELSRRLSGGR